MWAEGGLSGALHFLGGCFLGQWTDSQTNSTMLDPLLWLRVNVGWVPALPSHTCWSKEWLRLDGRRPTRLPRPHPLCQLGRGTG